MTAINGSGATTAQEAEFNLLGTWATEMDLDFEALIVDVRDLKSAFNSLVDGLQAQGLVT